MDDTFYCAGCGKHKPLRYSMQRKAKNLICCSCLGLMLIRAWGLTFRDSRNPNWKGPKLSSVDTRRNKRPFNSHVYDWIK